MVKTVAVYYRTSKDFKNQNKMQVLKCREFCRQNSLRIYKEYGDLNISGLTRNRKALGKMLEDAKQHKFSGVLVYRVDRLGRRFEILDNLSKELEANHIDLISTTQRFDSNTPEGKLMQRIFFSLAEFESSIISVRTKDGKRAKKIAVA